jgi:hypothetical protein
LVHELFGVKKGEQKMSVQEPTEQEIVDAVYSFAAEQMRSGVSPQQIQALLVEKGLDQSSAATVVSQLTEIRSKAIREASNKDMLYGALWCIGGIVVTVATLSAASGGGTYVVAWGAILFGGIQFFRGLTGSGGE